MQKITQNGKTLYLTDKAASLYKTHTETNLYDILQKKVLNFNLLSSTIVVLSTWKIKNFTEDTFITVENICSILSVLEADPNAPQDVLKKYLNDQNLQILVSPQEKMISFIPHIIGGYIFSSNIKIPRDILQYLFDEYLENNDITIETLNKAFSMHSESISYDLVPFQDKNHFYIWKVRGVNLNFTDSLYKEIEKILPTIYKLKDSGNDNFSISCQVKPSLSRTGPVKVNFETLTIDFLQY